MLADQRIGALIVLAGREPLEEHVRGGVPLDGRLSVPLLHSIFHPKTQAHDGAVIVEEDTLTRFGAHLPLSEDGGQMRQRGTRHAAGLGLSERSDALVLIVSEERGSISLAENSRLTTVAAGAPLAGRLRRFRAAAAAGGELSPAVAWRRGLGMGAASLLLAVGCWLLVAYRVETVQRVFHHVPVEYRALPKNWSVVEMEPANVRVTVTGSQRAFDTFDPGQMVISLDLAEIREGSQTIPISSEMLKLPSGLSVRQADTQQVTLTAHEMTERRLPVRVQLEGRPPAPLQLAAASASPAEVNVILRKVDSEFDREIPTESVWLNEVKQDAEVRARLILPPYASLADGQKPTVKVAIKLQRPAVPPAVNPPSNE